MVFSDLALGAALIQRQSLSEQDKNTAFWVTVGERGALHSPRGRAWPGRSPALYGEPEAKPLLVALSGSFIVTALGATQLTLMMREMDFRRRAAAMAGALVGAGCGVALAATGGGAWAIIAQYVAGAIVTTALVWLRSSWYPRFMFSKASLLDLGGFSIYMLGQRILYYLQMNGDRFLIGRFLGTAALGTYAVAYNTMLVPASKIGGPLQRVLSPAFSPHPGRARADRGRLGAGGPDHRRRRGARARRAGRGGARFRAGDPRRPVDRGGPGGPDPRVGGHHPGDPGPQRTTC